jgi:hypothetical protein
MRNILLGPRSGLLMPFSSVDNHATRYLDIKLIPNPAKGPFTLQFKTEEPISASIRILTINGQVLEQSAMHSYPAGMNRISFDHFQPPGGMYFVEIRNGETTWFEKLIVH